MKDGRSTRGWPWLPLFIAFAVISGAIFYAHPGAVAATLNDWKLLPRPEPLTELYLNDYAAITKSLPARITNGKSVTFSFTVHNIEGQPMVYPYRVSLVRNAATTTIDKGVISLADGAATTTAEKITFRSSGGSATVLVDLPDRQQSLHFYIPNRN